MKIKIDTFEISQKSNVFIIAELSANHNQDIEIAIETIRAAKRSGADAIKLQTYTPDTLTIDSDKSDFIIKGTIWNGKNYYSLYREAFTPWEWHEKLFQVAKEEGLICFSSPFDKTAVDFLEKLNVPAYKIASFEITDIPLIEYVASKGKPIILSTGIANFNDIKLAVDSIKNKGNEQVILLKCTSSYPAPIEEANLCMIKEFSEKFNVFSGLSDHTMGSTVPIMSIGFGCKVIEKHFILDRSIGGPDSTFSMDEKEFKIMVDKVREAEKSIGVISYDLTEKQIKGRQFSRSLYVVKDVNRGDLVDFNNVRSIRPGFSLHPKYYPKIIGKKFKYSMIKGSRITLDDFK
tara:strand:+ start:2050 stop:3093 length:1044 start_codon:yes stop_codon:yes gene_type:complete